MKPPDLQLNGCKRQLQLWLSMQFLDASLLTLPIEDVKYPLLYSVYKAMVNSLQIEIQGKENTDILLWILDRTIFNKLIARKNFSKICVESMSVFSLRSISRFFNSKAGSLRPLSVSTRQGGVFHYMCMRISFLILTIENL